MATFDMTTTQGRRNVCEEAERRLEQIPGNVERIAKFLQEVAETSAEERQSETFVRRVWEENPLFELGHGDYDVSAALTDSDFRRGFHELTAAHLPTALSERAGRLDEILYATLDLVVPFVPPNRSGGRDRPILKATRVFAALFPNDFTTLHYPGRTLYKHMGGSGLRDSPARANRYILDRLDGTIASAEPPDWHGVARHMMLPAILLQILREPPPPPIVRPELSRITNHFESIEEAGTLIFERDMVASLHLGLWARDRRHFAVLTGLSGTGKTQLALEYAKAVTGEDGESNGRIRTIAVQPGWYDPTPLLGYVNPLGDNRYTKTEFLQFVIRATESPSQPHVCVLDEMNLSHPESSTWHLSSARWSSNTARSISMAVTLTSTECRAAFRIQTISFSSAR